MGIDQPGQPLPRGNGAVVRTAERGQGVRCPDGIGRRKTPGPGRGGHGCGVVGFRYGERLTEHGCPGPPGVGVEPGVREGPVEIGADRYRAEAAQQGQRGAARHRGRGVEGASGGDGGRSRGGLQQRRDLFEYGDQVVPVLVPGVGQRVQQEGRGPGEHRELLRAPGLGAEGQREPQHLVPLVPEGLVPGLRLRQQGFRQREPAARQRPQTSRPGGAQRLVPPGEAQRDLGVPASGEQGLDVTVRRTGRRRRVRGRRCGDPVPGRGRRQVLPGAGGQCDPAGHHQAEEGRRHR